MNILFCCITDYGSVADYLNLEIFIIIAILVYSADRKRHRESSKLVEDLNKPIIGFIMNKKEDDEKYRIVNYGKGPAFNIVAAFKDKNEGKLDADWREHYLCYSLKENEDRLLKWKKGGHMWIVRFNDLFNHTYCTICQDDKIEIIDLRDNKNEIV